MSGLVKFIRFPVTRLVIWVAIMAAWYLGLNALPLSWELSYGLLAIGAALAAMFVGRVVEGRHFRDVGFDSRHVVRDVAAGFGLAALMMGAIIGVMALCGWYRITGYAGHERMVALIFVQFCFTGLLEEVAMRGVLFRIVEESLGSWISLGLSAVIFGLLHLGNPNATLPAALAIAVEAGVMLAGAYMLTRSLWLAIGMHWGWNFFQGPVFGTAVSGGAGYSLVHTAVTGPQIATGGAFGPEAGLVALAVGTGVGVCLLVAAARRGRVVAPFWRRRRQGAALAPEVSAHG